MQMKKWKAVLILTVLANLVPVLFGGCKPKEPARLTISVEGKEFSDSQISIDGTLAGRLTQTVTTRDGKIYIDGALSGALPSMRRTVEGKTRTGQDSEGGVSQDQGREEDGYFGCADTIILKPGDHTIVLKGRDGETLQIVTNVSLGYHLLTYYADKQQVKWDNQMLKPTFGGAVQLRR
jgi:hypothetical protein